ncbi:MULTISPECIES: hypothetical protein [Amycolatopsis]|uniref:hypothetical protein n=1 Tax=Amycolatopsis TaxID=1813 RepID=UPI001AD831EF|nr:MULTISPECIES: hypothetical protein [Amycolatopsis]
MLDIGLNTVPAGTMFVGIGASGTAVVGIAWLREPVSVPRIPALALIAGGGDPLQLTSRTA